MKVKEFSHCRFLVLVDNLHLRDGDVPLHVLRVLLERAGENTSTTSCWPRSRMRKYHKSTMNQRERSNSLKWFCWTGFRMKKIGNIKLQQKDDAKDGASGKNKNTNSFGILSGNKQRRQWRRKSCSSKAILKILIGTKCYQLLLKTIYFACFGNTVCNQR